MTGVERFASLVMSALDRPIVAYIEAEASTGEHTKVVIHQRTWQAKQRPSRVADLEMLPLWATL